MEQFQKQMVCLEEDADENRIDALVEQGLRVALIEGAYREESRAALCQAVTACFHRRNEPLGLALRLTPETCAGPLTGYQYIVLAGFSPDRGEAMIASGATDACWLVEEPDDVKDWKSISGVLTGRVSTAQTARDRGLLVAALRPDLPADALLWPKGTSPDRLSSGRKAAEWDDGRLSALTAPGRKSPVEDTAGELALLYARRYGAKAIMLLTVDGENLAPVSRFYPPLPIIAVAKRPEGEGMLLRQTLRWATLPTAIGRTPERPEEVERFVRFVAGLYGYQPGDRIIASGHWMAGENPHNIYCVTM